jgi:hypothetical protein
VYHDETQLRQASKDAARELDELLRADRENTTVSEATRPAFSPSDIR